MNASQIQRSLAGMDRAVAAAGLVLLGGICAARARSPSAVSRRRRQQRRQRRQTDAKRKRKQKPEPAPGGGGNERHRPVNNAAAPAAGCVACGQCPVQAPTWRQDRAFRGLVQFNCEIGAAEARSRHRLALCRAGAHARMLPVTHWFPSETKLEDRLARALAARDAISLKEFLESFEFFTRVRKHVRPAPAAGPAAVSVSVSSPPLPDPVADSGDKDGGGGGGVVVDLCCGHGLTGILFAVFERRVQKVLLVDAVCPPAHRAILAAAVEVAPWAADKVRFVEAPLAAVCDVISS